MDVTTITVQQFQTQFRRDFPYLDTITYSGSALYNTGQEVYYPTTQLFYTALQNGITGVTPDSDSSKWQLTNDDIDNYIQDADITNAFAEAQVVFNQALFGDDPTITLAYLYVAAHFLCNDIRASQAGIGSSASFPVNSRSVGSVSEAYTIPEAYTSDPVLAFYTSSSYGMKFLAMALPNMRGNMVSVYGGTNP